MEVRAAGVDDLGAMRQVRLQALKDSPEAFSSTYEREVAMSRDEWLARLDRGVTFLLFEEAGGTRAVGLACGVPDHDAHVTNLYGMWVHDDVRGTGGADGLVAAVVDLARSAGSARVRLSVVRGNDRARRFYERMGFAMTGRAALDEACGYVDEEMELLL